MKLETERLILRLYSLDDLDSVHSYGQNPDFTKYEPWGPNTLEQSKEFIERCIRNSSQEKPYLFERAVELKETGEQIGGCGLRRDSQDSAIANMGWAIKLTHQNQGYATEAATSFIEFGFNQLGLSVIYATCDTHNQASARVMEKLGMKKVGLMEKDFEQKGYLRDSYRYEILNPHRSLSLG